MSEWEERRFLSFDETPIFYRILEPLEKLNGVILVVHGMGEHSGRYQHVGEFFKVLGFATAAYDQRGFGKSGGRPGRIRRFADFHQDLLAFHSFILGRYPNKPIFLLGHSFGGLVSASYLALVKKHPPVKGLILSSPIFGIGFRVPWWRHWAAVLTSYLLPCYVEKTGIIATHLTHDRAMLEAYLADKLIHHKISTRLYRELHGMMAHAQAIAERLTTPTLVMQAGQDFIVSRKATERFFDKLAASDKTLEVFEDLYHEILNESTRHEILAKIGKWTLDRLA